MMKAADFTLLSIVDVIRVLRWHTYGENQRGFLLDIVDDFADEFDLTETQRVEFVDLILTGGSNAKS